MKKNVILYIRVSTDEQRKTGYSLRDQEEKLRRYCELYGYNIVAIYCEDYSAQTFNRPVYKQLFKHCQKEHKNIDMLLFVKWDRFSRNASGAYQVIDKFNDLNIIVNAIEQSLDLTIPEQKLMLAVYLAIPEVENERRSLNIIAGMRRAFKEGRYVVSPPKGYSMERDNLKKPIIVPNDDAKYIREAFELLATGLYNQKEVLAKLRSKGFKTSKSAFSRIIRNLIYCGEISLKAYKEEPAIIIIGIHEPIISKSLFDKVQIVIDGKKQQKGVAHKKINEKFPLKGFVLCPNCHNPLRASSSKGRNQYYAYYHCTSPCNTRYKLEDVEVWFNSFLGSITLTDNAQKLLMELIKKRFKEQTSSSQLGPKHYEKIEALNEKIIKLQDLRVDGGIELDDYHQAKARYQNQLEDLKELEENQKKQSEVLKIYRNGFSKLQTIDKEFVKSDIEHKRKLIGSMFPEKLQFEENGVRTADINPLLLKIASINKGFKGKKKRDKSKKNDLSHDVLKVGIEPTLPKKLDFESSASTNSAT